MRMKTAETAPGKRVLLRVTILLGLAALLLTGGMALRARDQLADKVVRLHVLANSDSEEDQALKLRVRDKVLERAEGLLARSADRAEAEALLRGDLLELERVAAEALGRQYAQTYLARPLTRTDVWRN